MIEDVMRALGGNQRSISRMMTLLEKRDPLAASVMQEIDPYTGRAYTIGITGPPGAGKSTLVARLTERLRQHGYTVAIIAVDPTSPFSGGALLGDRIRMQNHYLDPEVFIRSLSTRGQTGGLPRTIKSLARLLDAAGKDIILVETVGVGQTELGIMGVADTVLVTLVPESGDAIQTLKAGVMEIADIFVVNKADRAGADRMAADIAAMLRTDPEMASWMPPVLLTQAERGEGISELWAKIQEHHTSLATSDLASGVAEGFLSQLERRRQERRRQEFLELVQEELYRRLDAITRQDPALTRTMEKIAAREVEPFSAAMEFLERFQPLTSPLAPGNSTD